MAKKRTYVSFSPEEVVIALRQYYKFDEKDKVSFDVVETSTGLAFEGATVLTESKFEKESKTVPLTP